MNVAEDQYEKLGGRDVLPKAKKANAAADLE